MLVMMKSGSDDSTVKLSIVPQLLTVATILLSGIFSASSLHVKPVWACAGFKEFSRSKQHLEEAN